MKPKRIVRVEGSVEVEISFSALRRGMQFTAYDVDSTLNHGYSFIADSDPYINNGVYVIRVLALLPGSKTAYPMVLSSIG